MEATAQEQGEAARVVRPLQRIVIPPAEAVKYAVHLAKRHTNELGFIPQPKMERYARRGQLMLETENGEPCGYLVHGMGWPVCKIYQACVQYDARRREHGLKLVERLVRRARRRGCHAISLWCADDLEANAFWKAAGFQWAGQREGGEFRGHTHNRWVLSLPKPLLVNGEQAV